MPGKTSKEEVTSVSLSKESTTIKRGQTEQLVATTEPEGQPVTYKVTEGEEYISVSPEGLVTANTEGHGVVTVTAGDQSDTINVEVTSNFEM
ncbi:Ig-like domain-containing protein [Staphylococcus agnetis]|uniref:Ig-like domain-containing protein n=2 Tax=Staphylococcus TaxID=1279 RepID=UPI0030B9568B